MEHIKVILLVTSFIIPFILASQVLLSAHKNISKIIMSFALLNSGLIYLFNYFYFQKDYSFYYPLHSIHAGIELWLYPSIYLYIKSIVTGRDKLKNEIWHFLLGFIVIIFATWFFYLYVGKEDLIFFLKNNRAGYHFVGIKFQLLTISRYIELFIIAIQAICYSIVFVRIPKEYNERLKTEFSNIENFSIDWINKFNLSFGICGLVGFLFYTFTPIKGYHELVIEFVFFLFSAFLCGMGILSLKQQIPQVNLIEMQNFDTKINIKSKLKDERLIKELNNYIVNNLAYLDPEISLTNVSRILGTNRSYLSFIINHQFGMNFNTYINQFRVRFVNDYLEKNPLTSREELVQLSGFGSKSTMHRAMNKLNGL
jgi:AraC-like DNA-binding protein